MFVCILLYKLNKKRANNRLIKSKYAGEPSGRSAVGARCLDRRVASVTAQRIDPAHTN